MLQVKELNKTYKMNKTKQSFGALNSVSLDFPNKGFVFIIGKSGSGKSTLLNLLGGLDKPDGGEIIIKGKSSKSFSSKDFDSYRNTYLGFVFQEFNLLEHYSIEDNIKLALQLQSYKGDIQARCNEILQTVGLYDKRYNKINQISGGQKQRVAIARALVKNPEIILADEPTGNLDSETSEIIMDTLQQLSKEKLVIMVTHDVDYAAKYADRVIELKDGNVISDKSKEIKYHGEVASVDGTEPGIEKVIRLPKSGHLENSTIDSINELARQNSDKNLYVTLSFDENKVTTIEPASKELLSYEDEKEEVKLTYEQQSNFKLIKSKLPLKNTVKMATGNLWRKKIRNLFILVILVGAMFMFGFAETVNKYDYGNVVANTFDKGNIDLVHITNGQEYSFKGKFSNSTTSGSVSFTEQDITDLRNDFKTLEFYKAFYINTPSYLFQKQTEVIQPTATMSVAANVSQLSELNIPNDRLTQGKMPVLANEVVISDLVLPYLKNRSGLQLVLGDTIQNTTLVVSGIYESRALEQFPYLKDLSLEEYSATLNTSQKDAWTTYRSLNSMFIVNDLFYANYKSTQKAYTNNNADTRLMPLDKTLSFMQSSEQVKTIAKMDFVSPANVSKFKTEYTKTSLQGNEVIINGTFLRDYLGVEDLTTVTLPLNIKLKPAILSQAEKDSISNNLIQEYTVVEYFEYCTFQDIDQDVDGCGSSNFLDNKHMLYGSPIEIDMIMSDAKAEESMNFITLFTRLGNNISENARFFNHARANGYTFTSLSMNIINLFDAIVKALGSVFRVISIILAIFAAILLFQNISASVLAKKKEIGTLRAIGARGTDVAKIFIIEAVILTLITGVLGLLVLNSLSGMLNNYISNSLGFALSLFNVSWVIVAEILGLSIFLGILSAFIPSYKVARMRPIDAIKDK